MSELNVYHHELRPDEYDEFYLKYKADKVIAEKDSEIRRLENLCESYRIDCDNIAIREANTYKEIERDNKQIRHHKYKRCLAMAKWCDAELEKLDYKASVEYTNKDIWRIATSYFTIWHKRWLKLAEKLK